MIKIAIDAMGGDHGSTPIVRGTLEALKEADFTAVLVGNIEEIKPQIPASLLHRVEFVQSSDVIDMSDSATDALKRVNSSIYKAVELVRNKEAAGVVSAGHSGATMSLATLRIGRIKGVLRPAIATFMPTTKEDKKTLVLDVGANVDCKAEHLYQFGVMGRLYAKDILGLRKPKVGLLANGEEPSKGNEITKEAYGLLENEKGFKGNVEGNDIFKGKIDVVVCDGFMGNILLKTAEGVADSIMRMLKNNTKKSPIAIAGAMLMKKVFSILKQQVDYAEYGGAPLLGVNGCAIVSHGKSNSKAIKNAIFQAINFVSSDINADIAKKFSKKKA
jgi:glycerol-3-phosphate acyltransferase PlsX